jgi:hypothetical protein
VGWVERSEIRCFAADRKMGFAVLNPSYELHRQRSVEGNQVTAGRSALACSAARLFSSGSACSGAKSTPLITA